MSSENTLISNVVQSSIKRCANALRPKLIKGVFMTCQSGLDVAWITMLVPATISTSNSFSGLLSFVTSTVDWIREGRGQLLMHRAYGLYTEMVNGYAWPTLTLSAEVCQSRWSSSRALLSISWAENLVAVTSRPSIGFGRSPGLL